MLKRFYIPVILTFIFISCFCAKSFANNSKEISNNYFSFTMPDELNGIYTVDKVDNGIYILEKVSAQSEIGGFAFGFKIYKNPDDYAGIPNSKKIGELTNKKGVVYDMVFVRPTEIQYIEREDVQKNYERLYELGDKIEVKGINGSKYTKNKGMKGEEIYKNILKKYKKALDEKWDLEKYKKEGIHFAYGTLTNETGYAYYDLNSDGIDELYIGKNGNIDDVFTMVNRRPTHVASRGDADKFFACSEAFLCSEYSFDKNEKTLASYTLENNSADMYPQISYIYNANKNKKHPYFITYGNSDVLEIISKKLYKERIKGLYKYKILFDFAPLNK